MTKILIINTMAVDYNGVTDCILQYLRAMDRNEMKIDILSTVSVNPEMEKNFWEIGCRIVRLEYRNKNPFLYVLKLAFLVRKEKYDIVHAHGNSATLTFDMLGALLGGCRVRIAHGHNTQCANRCLDKILRPFFYRLYTYALACGNLAGEWLFSGRKFSILPNGRDIKVYRFEPAIREKVRTQYGLKNCLVIGHVGRFNTQKNHKFILELFEELKKIRYNTKLVLVGEGALFDETRESVVQKGMEDDVLFTGNINNVSEMLSAMDVMVLPSLYEGLPLVVMEWQAAGLPCIISDTITRECRVTDLVRFMSLSDGAKKWAEVILDISERERIDRYSPVFGEQIRNAGYSIDDNARELKNLYIYLSKRTEKQSGK